MAEFIQDKLRSQNLFGVLFVIILHSGCKANTITNCIALVLEFKSHFAEVVVLLEDVLLRTCFSDLVCVLEDSFDDLFIIGQSFLGEADVDVELAEAPKLMVSTSRELVGKAFCFEVAEQ